MHTETTQGPGLMINLFVLLIHQTQSLSAECPARHRLALQVQHRHRNPTGTGGMQEGHLTPPRRARGLPARRGISANTRSEPWMRLGRVPSRRRNATCAPRPRSWWVHQFRELTEVDLGLGWGRQQRRRWGDNRS